MRTPPRLMPALITPFTRAGEVDFGAHRHNLRTLSAAGIRGFLIGGSTGEGPYLEAGERKPLLEAVRDELGRTPFLLCGVTAETMRSALRQADEAASAGADGLLVLTPTSLARGRDKLIRRFYVDLAETTGLAVLLYSVPRYTAYVLPADVVVELAEHDNIVGMKDSGGDPVRMADLVERCADGFYMFSGSSPSLALALAAGAYGAINASTNYAAELNQEVLRHRRPGEAQARLTKLSRAVEGHGVPGVKAAAAGIGLRPGYPRAPLRPIGSAAAAKLAALAAG